MGDFEEFRHAADIGSREQAPALGARHDAADEGDIAARFSLVMAALPGRNCLRALRGIAVLCALAMVQVLVD